MHIQKTCRRVHSSIICNSKHTHTHTHKQNKTCKQHKHQSAIKWINILWDIHRMQYYAAVGINECLFHTATWMSLTGRHMSEYQKPDTEERTPCDLRLCAQIQNQRVPINVERAVFSGWGGDPSGLMKCSIFLFQWQ